MRKTLFPELQKDKNNDILLETTALISSSIGRKYMPDIKGLTDDEAKRWNFIRESIIHGEKDEGVD